jgi:energy-coupling factor transporter ATP-binding protein EcfA2
MRLASIGYSEFQGTHHEWTLETFQLGQVNLLVGRNATGKSRTLNVINSVAQMLCGERKAFASGCFDIRFHEADKKALHYFCEQSNNQVVREQLSDGECVLLRRVEGSYGWIFAEEVGKDMKFQIPAQEIAAFAKRDSIQHPFLERLFEWGSAVRYFEFGKTMGHANLGIPVKDPSIQVNHKDTTQVVAIYHRGENKYGDPFKEAVKADMAALGYHIDDLRLRRPANMVVQAPIPFDVVGLAAKESDLPDFVDQPSISQGMFRALSILVQLNYSVMSRSAACLLVDDIGEGLDYERSCRLIEVLRKKSHESSVQLIMSTNDRFVMNSVPLEEWCYLRRLGNHVRVLNYSNARDAFERFKITGLNNFDLLATDFLEKVTSNGQACSVR